MADIDYGQCGRDLLHHTTLQGLKKKKKSLQSQAQGYDSTAALSLERLEIWIPCYYSALDNLARPLKTRTILNL
jgi:hypothetical protein